MQELVDKKVNEIKELIRSSGAKGIVFGSSGGKDSVLVGILAKMATDNVLAVMMPCETKRNFGQDLSDAVDFCSKFKIEHITVDLTSAKRAILENVPFDVSSAANANIAPRLRMTTLYSIAQSKGYLVAGTGNKSEYYMGYFTKWGDGAYDFNPIADLTVTRVYEMLRFLKAPEQIINKAPSAGLYEGQTDESEMGVTYAEIDTYIEGKQVSERAKGIIEKAHKATEHKRLK